MAQAPNKKQPLSSLHPRLTPRMGSKSSKPKRPAPVKAKALTVPRIPQDVIEEILDHLATDSDPCGTLRPNTIACLRACALVSRSWVQPSRRHLFHTVVFTSRRVNRWFRTFPIPEESPARHIKNISVWFGDDSPIPEEFWDYTPWFTDADLVCLFLFEGLPPLRKRSFWRLPRSTTSLAIDTDAAILMRVRDITAQLSNLEDLSLSGCLVATDKRGLPGNGERLTVHSGRDAYDTIGMYLKTLSEPYFTEVCIHSTRKHLLSAVGLAEACCKTVVKLSHEVIPYGRFRRISSRLDLVCKVPTLILFAGVDGHGGYERSFDFSQFPNIQEICFGFRVGWREGGVPWIPSALSTLKPTTSPHLSAILLDFAAESSIINQSADTLIENMGNDIRRIADEVARIDREFKGTVALSIISDSVFSEVFNRLNVSFYS